MAGPEQEMSLQNCPLEEVKPEKQAIFSSHYREGFELLNSSTTKIKLLAK